MKEHEIVENFKEEGAITVETADVVTHIHHAHAKPSKKGFTLTTPVAIILAAVILGVSHIVYGSLISGTTASAPLTAFKGKAIGSDDLVTGNTKSKVVVVEYSDTECPFCAQLQPSMKRIKEEYASKVGFTYRYFPLTQIHPNAFEEARSVYCVGQLAGAAKKDEYVNAIFTQKMNAKSMTFAPGTKESLARSLGVNDAELKKCMSDQASNDAINASMQDGIAAGVQGTPATFVLVKNKKGYDVVSLVDGARPYEFIKAVLDEALAR